MEAARDPGRAAPRGRIPLRLPAVRGAGCRYRTHSSSHVAGAGDAGARGTSWSSASARNVAGDHNPGVPSPPARCRGRVPGCLRRGRSSGSTRSASDEAIRPWIGQLTRNCCLDRLRAREREVGLSPRSKSARADDAIAQIDEAFAVRRSLDLLSAECREILDRFFCRDGATGRSARRWGFRRARSQAGSPGVWSPRAPSSSRTEAPKEEMRLRPRLVDR